VAEERCESRSTGRNGNNYSGRSCLFASYGERFCDDSAYIKLRVSKQKRILLEKKKNINKRQRFGCNYSFFPRCKRRV